MRTTGNTGLTELVTYIAKALVDQPDEVQVEEVPEPDQLVVELTVADEDLGKVIGKAGKTARAMRALVAAAAAKTGTRATLEILE